MALGQAVVLAVALLVPEAVAPQVLVVVTVVVTTQ
jgi:hypothetical protein